MNQSGYDRSVRPTWVTGFPPPRLLLTQGDLHVNHTLFPQCDAHVIAVHSMNACMCLEQHETIFSMLKLCSLVFTESNLRHKSFYGKHRVEKDLSNTDPTTGNRPGRGEGA